jgi:hypothetical protein
MMRTLTAMMLSLSALILSSASMTPAFATTLPQAPLDVGLPSTLYENRDAAVTFETFDSLRGGVPFDVYVIRIPPRQPVLRYLSSTGIWTLVPTPWLRYPNVTTSTSQVATWREDGPAGFVTLLVVFVRAGASPSDRGAWLFRPVLGRVSVRPAAAAGGRVFAGALGVVTVATCALVLLGAPRRLAMVGVRRPASG